MLEAFSFNVFNSLSFNKDIAPFVLLKIINLLSNGIINKCAILFIMYLIHKYCVIFYFNDVGVKSPLI